MDTQHHYFDAQKTVSLTELETRKEEFEVPHGAIEAFKAGAAPVIVFMRDTGEEYMLADNHDDQPPGMDRRL
jgi:hypothetical protein